MNTNGCPIIREEELNNHVAAVFFGKFGCTHNADMLEYNTRGEVVTAMIDGKAESHGYDFIGNSHLSSFNVETNFYTANSLNQYTTILRASASPREIVHDVDGNMLSDGILSFTYDAANRLKTVSSNGVLLVTNFYDAKSRRVKKETPEVTFTFFYDGWNLIEERVAYTNGVTSTIRYFWGKDLSGTLQGAGGVGGLLYLTIDDVPFIPCYDNIGNITRYLDANGNVVASYTYDAFGKTIFETGPLAYLFRHRFSTKYLDVEAGHYYYGYRFYSPSLMRWLNRDPIEEEGGVNLYCFCGNALPYKIDLMGKMECCRCVYSGNLLSNGQSTGRSKIDGKKCFYLSEGGVVDVIEDYPCEPKYLKAVGNCFAKSCRVTTRYRCQKCYATSDPTKYAYFWVFISDEVQPCSAKNQ